MTASATVRDTTTDDPWHGFQPGGWQHSIDVRGFILANFTPYLGDASFLAGPTDKTLSVWDTLQRDFLSVERARRVYDVETHIPGDVDAFPAGYICADDDVIVGLQTDVPLIQYVPGTRQQGEHYDIAVPVFVQGTPEKWGTVRIGLSRSASVAQEVDGKSARPARAGTAALR